MNSRRLGDQFNGMAARLQESYATLEAKVDRAHPSARTRQRRQTRFLAAASHDLRQPLHALGLLVAQLDTTPIAPSGAGSSPASTATAAMNELFNALFDISKLDAGVDAPTSPHFRSNR